MTKHPIQVPIEWTRSRKVPLIDSAITLRAYEVYCHVYGPQEAIVVGSCRGGFSATELIAFLYTRSFPKEEWKRRVNEAFLGMDWKD